jgi:hypothetical protein
LIDLDDSGQWFSRVGTRTMRTIQLWAKQVGLSCAKNPLSLTFNDVSLQDFEEHLAVLTEKEVHAVKLAELMPNKQVERFDRYVTSDFWTIFLNSASVTPGGRIVIAGGYDSVLRVWNGTNAEVMATFAAPGARCPLTHG